jgi:hypothetical protein
MFKNIFSSLLPTTKIFTASLINNNLSRIISGKYEDIMSAVEFPTVRVGSTSILAPISDWGIRLVAPLGSSFLSKGGMIELAGRVYWIFPLMIAAVVVAWKYGYLTGRATPPDSSSTNPTGVLTKDTADDSPTIPGNIGDGPGDARKTFDMLIGDFWAASTKFQGDHNR